MTLVREGRVNEVDARRMDVCFFVDTEVEAEGDDSTDAGVAREDREDSGVSELISEGESARATVAIPRCVVALVLGSSEKQDWEMVIMVSNGNGDRPRRVE